MLLLCYVIVEFDDRAIFQALRNLFPLPFPPPSLKFFPLIVPRRIPDLELQTIIHHNLRCYLATDRKCACIKYANFGSASKQFSIFHLSITSKSTRIVVISVTSTKRKSMHGTVEVRKNKAITHTQQQKSDKFRLFHVDSVIKMRVFNLAISCG